MAAFPDLPTSEWFALARAATLHARHLKNAHEKEKVSATRLVGRSVAELAALGLPAVAAQRVSAPDAAQVERDRRWAREAGVQLVPLEDGAYPSLLAQAMDAPVALWVRGSVADLVSPQLAIVGSRHPTAAGARHAAGFARELVAAGLTITSGLARGIDGAAHEGALAGGGRTIAVCGTGLDECYPARHASLAGRIVAAGALVSEFPPGTLPRPEHFPRRNRIISALSAGVLVIEAARDSGSLITARLAGEHGRCILALPGSIDSPVSRGCHHLIREGAILVRDVADVLQELRGLSGNSLLNQSVENAAESSVSVRRLDKPQEMLLDALGFEPSSIDDLIDRTGQSAQEIAIRLSRLELEGLVETLPGGQYGRLPDDPTPGK